MFSVIFLIIYFDLFYAKGKKIGGGDFLLPCLNIIKEMIVLRLNTSFKLVVLVVDLGGPY